jgi:hypothetical protein
MSLYTKREHTSKLNSHAGRRVGLDLLAGPGLSLDVLGPASAQAMWPTLLVGRPSPGTGSTPTPSSRRWPRATAVGLGEEVPPRHPRLAGAIDEWVMGNRSHLDARRRVAAWLLHVHGRFLAAV